MSDFIKCIPLVKKGDACDARGHIYNQQSGMSMPNINVATTGNRVAKGSGGLEPGHILLV